jgi:hypothetical protein
VPIQDGLYVNVEPVEERFLFNSFNRSTSGNLYEFEIDEDFVPEMLDRTEWKGFSQYHNKLDLVRATEHIAAGDLESVVDMDQFNRTWAMEILLDHWDNYAIGRNNAYVCNDAYPVEDPNVTNGDLKFKFITSGIDQILQDNPVLDLRANGVLAQKVLADPVLKAKLAFHLVQHLRGKLRQWHVHWRLAVSGIRPHGCFLCHAD